MCRKACGRRERDDDVHPHEDGSNKKHFFRYGEAGQEEGDGRSCSYKECFGDQEDVMTLYELVQESLGESVRLAKDKGVRKVEGDDDWCLTEL